MAHHLRILLVSMGMLLASGPQSAAVGDEVFICDGNSVVRVTLSQLDHMKRTNPCVAAHYGLTVKARPEAKKADQKSRVHKLVSQPTRAKRVSKRTKSVARRSRSQRSKTAEVKAKRAKAPVKVGRPEFKVYRRDDVLPVEEIAAEAGDYRNVRVLNAKSQPTKWHQHSF